MRRGFHMRLENKVAIVTGAGKGIGKETALMLAEEGAIVVAVSRTQSDLDKIIEEVESLGGRGLAVTADLTIGEEVQAMVDTVMNEYGRIDILVNNAGGYPKEIYDNIEHQAIKIWDWSEEQWDQIIKTNLKPTFLCTSKVAPIMMEQRSGDIINVSSRMGRIASQMGAYAVAKGGIVTLTKTCGIQLQEYGVRANCVAPGIVDTPGQRVYNHSVGQDEIPMGDAKDVPRAVLYLVLDAPKVMTGQTLDLFTTV